MISEKFLIKICSISVKENNIILCDCEGYEILLIKNNKIIYSHSGVSQEFPSKDIDTIRYSYTINSKFRKKHLNNTDSDLSAVWILTGFNESENEEKLLQTGRNRNTECMLKNDINSNVHSIIKKEDNKYGRLKYDTLSFYQVNIDSYLREDKNISQILRDVSPENKHLKNAYFNIKASYAEGKIASSIENEALWHKSPCGIDGDICNFYTYSFTGRACEKISVN